MYEWGVVVLEFESNIRSQGLVKKKLSRLQVKVETCGGVLEELVEAETKDKDWGGVSVSPGLAL